jgi:hypothetical protein
MMIITSAPNAMAMAVPATPELGRNFLPGLMKEPHPMIQPKARAQTLMGFNCFFKALGSFCFIIYSVSSNLRIVHKKTRLSRFVSALLRLIGKIIEFALIFVHNLVKEMQKMNITLRSL